MHIARGVPYFHFFFFLTSLPKNTSFENSHSLKRENYIKAKLGKRSSFCFRSVRWCNSVKNRSANWFLHFSLLVTVSASGFHVSLSHLTFLCLRQDFQVCGVFFVRHAWNVQCLSVLATLKDLFPSHFPFYFHVCCLFV